MSRRISEILWANAALVRMVILAVLIAQLAKEFDANNENYVPASLAEAATAVAVVAVVEQAYHVTSETSVALLEDELEKTFRDDALTCMSGEPCTAMERQMDIVRILGTDAFDVQPPTAMASWILAVRNSVDDLDRCLPETNPVYCDLEAGKLLVTVGAIPLP